MSDSGAATAVSCTSTSGTSTRTPRCPTSGCSPTGSRIASWHWWSGNGSSSTAIRRRSCVQRWTGWGPPICGSSAGSAADHRQGTFHRPETLIPAATVVVSPLIALQHDQVGSIGGDLGSAVQVDSAMTTAEREAAFGDIAGGEREFVFVAPEPLANEGRWNGSGP